LCSEDSGHDIDMIWRHRDQDVTFAPAPLFLKAAPETFSTPSELRVCELLICDDVYE
jgi:hypothetical protein